jgi:molybdate transport system permease protein
VSEAPPQTPAGRAPTARSDAGAAPAAGPSTAAAAEPAATPRAARRRRGASISRAPAGFVPVAAVGVAFLTIPLVAVVLRAPWRDLPSILAEPGVFTALKLSLVCSLGAVALSMVLGTPLAWLLARATFPGRNLVRALVIMPMVLPPVVGGVALLLAFGRHGVLGQWLDRTLGITLPFTTAGAILAEAFVAMPFFVITLEAGLRAAGRRYEDAAATLGASRWRTFVYVTLPLAIPSLAAGAALSWARALGEFGATITFAGNLPGTTQTMPLAVYLALQNDTRSALALSLVMLGVSLVILIVLRGRWFPGK